jgi:hypothetical protein
MSSQTALLALTAAVIAVSAHVAFSLEGSPKGPVAPASVRPPAVAGAFYPSDPVELRSAVEASLKAAVPAAPPAGRVIAIVAPHAGYVYSGAVAGKAFAALPASSVKRVVVIGVAHYGAPAPVWVDDVAAYRTPLGDVPCDREAMARLATAGLPRRSNAASREHSIEVELPFLQSRLGKDWTLVPILAGGADIEDCAKAAAALRTILDDETLVVVSSDFTHYGRAYDYVPFEGDAQTVRARMEGLDGGALKAIVHKDAAAFDAYVRKTGATICGRSGIMVLLQALPARAVGRRIAYATSADVAGGSEMSVAYAALAFEASGVAKDLWQTGGSKGDTQMSSEVTLSAEERATLLALARRALEAHVLAGKELVTTGVALTDALKQKRGAFVTLEVDGSLRGCIGYVEAMKPLWQTVVENAVNAAVSDPRFPAVTAAEVPAIHIEISAMTPLRQIRDVSEIQVGKHGLMMTRGWCRGLLLPQVATEYGWTRDEFLRHTCVKAGLPPDAWKDPQTRIEIFSADVFGEDEVP